MPPLVEKTAASPLRFPHELLLDIFSFCDAPTLAAVSRVSFACLELSSKLLYTDVVLTDEQSIIKLFRLSFRDRLSTTKSARVSRHTTVTNIDTVTLIAQEPIHLRSLERFNPFPPRLPISTVLISVPKCYTDRHWEEWDYSSDVSTLFELVSPIRCVVRERPTDEPHPEYPVTSWVTLFAAPEQDTLGGPDWSRFRTLVLSSVLVDFTYLYKHLAAHPKSDVLPPLRTFFDLTHEDLVGEDDLDDLAFASDVVELNWENFHQSTSRSELRAVVSSSEAKTVLETHMREDGQYAAPDALGTGTFVDAATPRVRHLLESLADGAGRGTDWGALDIA